MYLLRGHFTWAFAFLLVILSQTMKMFLAIFHCLFRQIERRGAEENGEFRGGQHLPSAYLSNLLCALCVKIGFGLVGLGFLPLVGYAATVSVAYDPVDCTANLQAALSGTADTIIIPNTGSPWVTARLYLS